ncbi:MAG: 3-methyl-2-oxobutanoate hydroxymethyltransferase [Deltaproteobacteria bacterium]|nr:3-methyl-2-oxobutanoate hydroxymethyltransferase [Deltaproteobacteria bacterium]
MKEAALPTRVKVPDIRSLKPTRNKEQPRISALTAYDYTFASLLDEAGVEIILVGDSLASTVQGLSSTLPVTLDEMVYHCRCVSAGVKRALVVGDLPFMSYQVSPEAALASAGRLIKDGNVAAVKLEGGVYMEDTIARLVQVDIPVMGHVGLTPQSFHRMGGHKIQGRAPSRGAEAPGGAPVAGSRERVIEDALAVERAGAFAIVLEGIPAELAKEITEMVEIPTIGIGAGPDCDGQILVSYDMLGLSGSGTPSFVKRYAELGELVRQSAAAFKAEVQGEKFPAAKPAFKDQRRLRPVKVG